MKTIVIVIFCIMIITGLYSLTYWTEFSFRAYRNAVDDEVSLITGATPDKVDNSVKYGSEWQQEISGEINDNLSYDLQNDLFISQKSKEKQNSYFNNDLKITLHYRKKNNYLKLYYSNRFYEENETLTQFYPGFINQVQPHQINNLQIFYKTKFANFDFSILSHFRSLNYYSFNNEEDADADKDDEDDDEDEWNYQTEFDNDIYLNSEFGYSFQPNWRLFVLGFYKDDLSEISLYDNSHVGMGVSYDRAFDMYNYFSGQFRYFYRHSEKIAAAKNNYFHTKLRYTKRMGSSLAGFITYINRSCYDKANSRMLRIANLIRLQAKYRYKTADFLDSYLTLGYKYNLENSGSIAFIENNQSIWRNFFINSAIEYFNTDYQNYQIGFEYFLTPLKSIWLKHRLSNAKENENLFRIGTTLIF